MIYDQDRWAPWTGPCPGEVMDGRITPLMHHSPRERELITHAGLQMRSKCEHIEGAALDTGPCDTCDWRHDTNHWGM